MCMHILCFLRGGLWIGTIQKLKFFYILKLDEGTFFVDVNYMQNRNSETL